ncbi:MAG: 4Fe-4S binding protein [Gammaproteobacteria bacterium]|nr:4Fe-4S binding protein [Gammaproteobacteria bacterium]
MSEAPSMQEPANVTWAGASALPDASADGQARAAAMRALQSGRTQPTAAVGYESAGSLLIIGPRARVTGVVELLKKALDCTLAITDAVDQAPLPPKAAALQGLPIVCAAPTRINGHLGRFEAFVGEANLSRLLGRKRLEFDLVLDLGVPALIQYEIPPPGYYAPGDDPRASVKALAELPGLVGEFEKPKYFDYNADICAHGRSGIQGCTRCLDACPTNAIGSLKELIRVDPYLCQGGGVCATACPTGAITYAYPHASDLLESIRQALKAYRAAGGHEASLLFHDCEQGRERVDRVGRRMPESVIPAHVEEVGAVGLDAWLASLAYGASQVLLLATRLTPPKVLHEMRQQLGVASALLQGMGYDGQRVRLVEPETDEALLVALGTLGGSTPKTPADFATHNEKRNTLRMALDHLHEQTLTPAASAALPAGAPFGDVVVDREACTLCMACTSVCPASALIAGGDAPTLSFIEWNCVQCGLCEIACPEDAITLVPRIVYDPEVRTKRRTLNEEQPFCCVECGKPFATRRMMETMTARLKNHWMFQDPQALRRLKMCEICRTRDMFSHDLTPEVYSKPGPP